MNTTNRKTAPSTTVIVPSLDGASSNLERLTATVLDSGLPDDRLEILAAIGVRPNGRARDVGALHASGKYLIFMDEDVSFPDPGDLRTLVEYLRDHDGIGLVGPAQQIPPSLPETLKNRARQMPRAHVESPETFTESDMVTHACMAIRRETFLDVGMEHPNLISGTDPDLRNRVREAGYGVGIVPGTRVYHPPIDTIPDLVRKNFRGGRRSRAVKRNHPHYHLPAEPDIRSPRDTERLDTFPAKARKHIGRFVDAITSGNTWWVTAQLTYLLGYCSELVFPSRKVEPIPYPDPPSPETSGWQDFIEALGNEGTVKRLYPEPETRLQSATGQSR